MAHMCVHTRNASRWRALWTSCTDLLSAVLITSLLPGDLDRSHLRKEEFGFTVRGDSSAPQGGHGDS